MTGGLCLLIIIILIVIRVRKKNFLDPLSIFLSLWFFIVISYNLKFYELPSVGSKTWSLIILGIISYFLGYVSNLYKNRIDYNNIKPLGTYEEEFINVNILILISIVAIIFMLPTFKVQFINMLNGNTFVDNKHLLMDNQISLGFTYIYLAKPLRIILSMIVIIMISSKKSSKVLFFLVMILMIMDFVCTGSKIIFFNFGINLIYLIILKNSFSVKNIIINNLKKMALGLIVIIGIVYYMSRYSSVFEYGYYYLVGCLPFFDYSLNNITNNFNALTFGFLTLNGLLRVPITFLNSLNIIFYPNLLSVADNYLIILENFIYLNNHTIFNAFSTIFFNLYLDFREPGIIIGMFIFGFISAKVYYKLIKFQTNYYYLLYLFIFTMIINCQSKSLLTNIAYAISLLLILTLFKIILNKKIIF